MHRKKLQHNAVVSAEFDVFPFIFFPFFFHPPDMRTNATTHKVLMPIKTSRRSNDCVA